VVQDLVCMSKKLEPVLWLSRSSTAQIQACRRYWHAYHQRVDHWRLFTSAPSGHRLCSQYCMETTVTPKDIIQLEPTRTLHNDNLGNVQNSFIPGNANNSSRGILLLQMQTAILNHRDSLSIIDFLKRIRNLRLQDLCAFKAGEPDNLAEL
jgi:hypothetical protein